MLLVQGVGVKACQEKTLSSYWENVLRTLHGLHSNGFPNCFFLGFTQSGQTVNAPHALDEQAKHLAYILDESRARGASTVEASAEAEQQYVEEIHRLASLGRRFYSECTPGYYNGEGTSGNKGGFFSNMYGGGPTRFFKLLHDGVGLAQLFVRKHLDGHLAIRMLFYLIGEHLEHLTFRAIGRHLVCHAPDICMRYIRQ